MSNEVKFEEDEVLVDSASKISRQSALTGLLIRTGLVKSESQASYVLIGIMVACFLATLYVISRYIV